MFDNWDELEKEASKCRKCGLCETKKNVVALSFRGNLVAGKSR